MLSSTDVSSLFASQQAQFAQQNAYAQQLGAMAPQAGGFFRPPPPSFPGMVPPPAGYSYAPMPMQTYQLGNRVAGGVMSGMGGAMHLGGAALGAASMFGRMGAIAPLIDPFAGAMAGYGAAGLGGAALGAAAPMALAYGASRAMGSFVHGGQQQSMINETMSSTFGHMNPMSRTGQGFDRTAMQGVEKVIRQIANVPEMMTSVEELTRMIPKLRQMGTMQGVHDVQEFSRRLKEQVTQIRDMSKILGTTMDEASTMFAHAKAVGSSNPLQNALSVQFTAAQTGMSTGQVMGMQQAGAGMAVGMGIRRSVGATTVTNIAQMLQKGVDSKRLQQSDLEDLTGQQGPEAVGAASQMMTNRLVQVAQGTAPGKLMMAGLAKFDANGRYLGIDENLAKGVQSGAIGREELLRRASKLSTQQKESFSGHLNSASMELAGKLGPGGYGQFLKGVVGARYGENATQLLMTKLGFSETEADISEKMSGMVGTGGEDQQLFGKLQQRQAAIKEQTDPSAIWQRIKTKLHAKTFGRLEEAGARFHAYVGKSIDDFVDDLTGRAIVSMSEAGAKKLEGAFGPGGKKTLEDMLKGAGGSGTTPQSIAKMLSGPSAGETLSSAFNPFSQGAKSMMAGDFRGALSAINGFSSDTTTGRSSSQQFTRTMEGLGISGEDVTGLTDAAVERTIRGRQKQLGKIGSSFGGLSDSAALRMGDSFSEASEAKKLEMLTDYNTSMGGRIHQKQLNHQKLTAEEEQFASMQQQVLKATGGKGSLGYNMATAMAKGVGIKLEGIADLQGMRGDQTVSDIAKGLRSAEDAMVSKIGADGASFIKGNPKLAGVLSILQGNSSEKHEIVKALTTMTPSEAAEALKKYGVQASDVSALRSLAQKIDKTDGSMQSINDYVAKSSANDALSFLKAAGDAGKDVTDKVLGGALADLGDLANKPGAEAQAQVGGKVEGVQKALADVQRRLMKASPEEQKKILAGLGSFAGGAQNASLLAKGLGKSTTLSELAKRFGIDEKELQGDLASHGIGASGTGKITVTDAVRQEAAALGAGQAGAGRILAGGKAAAVGGQSNELKNTLDKVSLSMDRVAGVIAIVTKDKDAQRYLEATKNGLSDTGKSSSVDKTAPGPT